MRAEKSNDRRLRFWTIVDRVWRRIAAISFILALAIPVGTLMGFRLIVTSSVPEGLWFVHSGTVVRGEYVLVCLPREIAVLGYRARYLWHGVCPGNVVPLMKRVIAMSGDMVNFTADGVWVNGALVRDSRPLLRDSLGHPIPGHAPNVPTIVPSGHFVALGDWFKSWDSRYFGSIAEAGIIGIGVPLITLPAGS